MIVHSENSRNWVRNMNVNGDCDVTSYLIFQQFDTTIKYPPLIERFWNSFFISFRNGQWEKVNEKKVRIRLIRQKHWNQCVWNLFKLSGVLFNNSSISHPIHDLWDIVHSLFHYILYVKKIVNYNRLAWY